MTVRFYLSKIIFVSVDPEDPTDTSWRPAIDVEITKVTGISETLCEWKKGNGERWVLVRVRVGNHTTVKANPLAEVLPNIEVTDKPTAPQKNNAQDVFDRHGFGYTVSRGKTWRRNIRDAVRRHIPNWPGERIL